MEFIKNYFNGKTVAFYVAFGVSAFSLISAIVYAAVFGGSEYVSWGAFVMLLLAFPAFLALSYFGYGKIASGIVAALNFASFVLIVAAVFPFILKLANQYAMDGTLDGGAYFGGAIAVLIFTLICAIMANVLAWLKMKQSQSSEISEEKQADNVEGELA